MGVVAVTGALTCGGIAVVDSSDGGRAGDGRAGGGDDDAGCDDFSTCCQEVLELRKRACPPPPGQTSTCDATIADDPECLAAVMPLLACIRANPDSLVCDDNGTDRVRCDLCGDLIAATMFACGLSRECLAP